MRRMLVAFAVVLIGIGASACGRESFGGGGQAAVSDSAGIQIVENRPVDEDGTALWGVTDTPVLSIGAIEGEKAYLLDRVSGVVRQADGTIVIANGGTNQLRFFDSAGRHVRTVGGTGEGPGEFVGLRWIQLLTHDTIVAYDWRLGRATVLDPAGAFIRATTFDSFPDGSAPEAVGVLSNGVFLAQRGGLVAANELQNGVTRPRLEFLLLSFDGTLLQTVGSTLGPETFVETDGRSIRALPLMFGRSHDVEVGSDQFFIGSSDAFSIAVYGPSGELRRMIRRGGEPVPVTDEDLDQVRETALAEIGSGPWRPAQELMLERMPVPSTRPAFASFEVGEDGNLWVQEYSLPHEPNRWTNFDGNGVFRGAVILPSGFRPTAFLHDLVIGVLADETDVERVVGFRLLKEG